MKERDTLSIKSLVAEAKEQLRRAPLESAVSVLQRHSPQPPLLDVTELEGEWTLLVPKEGNIKAWMRRHGALKGMKLLSTPTLSIDRRGLATSEMRLRWGLVKAPITRTSEFRVLNKNLLRERMKTVTPRKWLLGSPGLMMPRTARVLYFDHEVLVVRDALGMDVLWRNGPPRPRPALTAGTSRQPRAASAAAPTRARKAPVSKSSPLESAAPLEEAAADPMAQMKHLASKVESMQTFLASQQAKADKDRADSKDLRRKITRLEKEAGRKELEIKVIDAKLLAAEGLRKETEGERAELAASLLDKKQQLDIAESWHESIMEELAQVTSSIAAHNDQAESLLGQLRLLHRRQKGEKRSVRQAAIKKTRAEMQAAKQEAKRLVKTQRDYTRREAKAAARVQEQQKIVDREQALLDSASSQCEARQAEVLRQKDGQVAAMENFQALYTSVAEQLDKLEQLEELRANELALISEVQTNLQDLGIHSPSGRFRLWPFGRR